jgi:hypothetical protein
VPLRRGLAATDPSFDPRLLEEESPAPREPNPIELSPTARHELQGLFQRAMVGTLPRARDLKEWEPDKLNARHIQMIMMRACGMRNNEIAELLDVGEANVSVVLGHPDSQFLLSKILSYAAETVTDIPTRFKAHAAEALDTALHWMRHGSEKVASANAFQILDRAGYGAEKKQHLTHELQLPKEQAGQLTRALAQSRDITPLTRINAVPGAAGGPGDASQGTIGVASSASPDGAVRLPSSLPQDPTEAQHG